MQDMYFFYNSPRSPFPLMAINNQIYPLRFPRPKQLSSLPRTKPAPAPTPTSTTTSKPTLKSATLPHDKPSNKPKVSKFGPNAHLAKVFVPSSNRRSDPKSSPCSKEEEKEAVVHPTPSPLPVPSPSANKGSDDDKPLPVSSASKGSRDDKILHPPPYPSKWSTVHIMKRLPPGLPIPCHQDEHDIFIGMTTTGLSPINIPYIGHHILDHSILDPPTYPSNSSKRGPDSLNCWHHLALDIQFPTLGLGLHDLLANNRPRRPSAFPNFERGANFHAYFLSSSSAKVTSPPPGLEKSHFSFFPWPMCTTGTSALSSSLSSTTTPSSRSTTVCSSVSSSPTLSSISTPGGYFIDDESVGESMMSHGDILKVCAALVQTIEPNRANQQHRSMSSRRVGVIGGHLPPKTWSFAEGTISCLPSGIDTSVDLFRGSQW